MYTCMVIRAYHASIIFNMSKNNKKVINKFFIRYDRYHFWWRYHKILIKKYVPNIIILAFFKTFLRKVSENEIDLLYNFIKIILSCN